MQSTVPWVYLLVFAHVAETAEASVRAVAGFPWWLDRVGWCLMRGIPSHTIFWIKPVQRSKCSASAAVQQHRCPICKGSLHSA